MGSAWIFHCPINGLYYSTVNSRWSQTTGHNPFEAPFTFHEALNNAFNFISSHQSPGCFRTSLIIEISKAVQMSIMLILQDCLVNYLIDPDDNAVNEAG